MHENSEIKFFVVKNWELKSFKIAKIIENFGISAEILFLDVEPQKVTSSGISN